MNRDELEVREREKYVAVWAGSPVYAKHSPGERHVPEAYGWLTMNECQTVIDFGCGDGRAMDQFRKLGVPCLGIDIAHESPYVRQQALWDPIPKAWHADFGFSCDVLEHLPTETVPDAIANMADATRKAAWVQVAMFPDTVGTQGDWGPLHLTIRDMAWWRHALGRSFRVVCCVERRRRATFLLQV